MPSVKLPCASMSQSEVWHWLRSTEPFSNTAYITTGTENIRRQHVRRCTSRTDQCIEIISKRSAGSEMHAGDARGKSAQKTSHFPPLSHSPADIFSPLMETCELGFMLEGRRGLAAPAATEKSYANVRAFITARHFSSKTHDLFK